MMSFAAAALRVMSAAEKHNVTLFQPSIVNGTELAPGDYTVAVDNDKVVISKGKQKVEAAVKVESMDAKFDSTSVRYNNEEGKYKLKEIRLGGTNRKLVFDTTQNGL